MKVIDLYNKIANGEHLPEKIKWNDTIYIKDKSNQYYCDDYDVLLDSLILPYLNEEIEIIENNKIDNINYRYFTTSDTKEIVRMNCEELVKVKDKLNEIIDYINKENK